VGSQPTRAGRANHPPPGTPDEIVYEQARSVIAAFAGGRGYLFAGTHNIPGDTPPGHLKAILRAFDACRFVSQAR
jgi:uroporphyrinogen-III decarboxylase